MRRSTNTTTKRKAMPPSKPPSKAASIIFAAVFIFLSVLAIDRGLDIAAATGIACLLLLIFAMFLRGWKINFKDYFAFHKDEK
jgi:hypothetical protein